jgi:hypothetical protein
MAMDGPGCVMSEHPLTRFRSDTVDTDLLGEWSEPDDPDAALALSVDVRSDGKMEFRSYDSSGYTLLTGYTSLVDGERYANLQFVDADCVDCSDEERQELKARFRDDYAEVLPDIEANACTWLIVRYRLEADRLRFHVPDIDFLDGQIESGALRGRPAAGDTAGYEPCITASARRLRRYVGDNAERAFPESEGDVLVRRSEPPAAGL